MSETTPVDRATAARINPLIDSIWTEGTLSNVASVVYEIGFMVSETQLAKENTFHVFEVAAAALWWEGGNIESRRLARLEKEKNHV